MEARLGYVFKKGDLIRLTLLSLLKTLSLRDDDFESQEKKKINKYVDYDNELHIKEDKILIWQTSGL